MDKIEDSLQDLEKAKQELLHKLKELEKLEETVKKQIEIEKDSEKNIDSVTPSSTEETVSKSPPAGTPIPNKEKPEEQKIQDNTEQQKAKKTAEPISSEKIEESPVNQTVELEPKITATQPESVSENEKSTEKSKKETISPNPEKTESTHKEIKKTISKKKKPEKKKTSSKEKKTSKSNSKSNKKAELEKNQIQNYNVSTSNRLKGKAPAESGNKGMKHTSAEVFIFVVDDNELQLKVLQEQFKNTKSFKKTKGFTNGADLLSYIKDKKFPRHSILIVVMDYFLEDSDDEESQNGIAILNQLKEYDPNIEVIMLSSHSDVDIATSSSYFGAVTFIQKGQDAFKKIINNLIWAIHQQEKIRKKAETKRVIKMGLIVFVLFLVILIIIDASTNALHLYEWPWFLEEVAPTTVAPPQ